LEKKTMINQMYSHIELRFWDWAIPVLSHSYRVQQFIRQLHPLANRSVLKKLGIQSGFVALTGFASGIVIATMIR
jgi:hypothetical protein